MATSKILVIDDSRVIRKTVRDMLPEGDFEVIEAKDGLEGIQFVEQEHPTLIMLDFILPKMSGWDVFQQIQAHPDYQKIPLVLMSGKKEEVTSKISEPFEFFEFIEKPFDRTILADAIRVAMTKARKPRPRATELTNKLAAVDAATSNEELTELQDRLAHTQTQLELVQQSSSAQIQALQAQLDRLERSTSDQIQALSSQLAEMNGARDAKFQQLSAKIDSFPPAGASVPAADPKVAELETEIDTLKKQLGQLVLLIKKRLA